jgi:predicted ester cyclase
MQIAEGDVVANRIVGRGTHTGVFWPKEILKGNRIYIPAAGNPVSFTCISMDRVQEGKIVDQQFHMDWIKVLFYDMGAATTIPTPPE